MRRLQRLLRRVHTRERHQQSIPASVVMARSEPKAVFAHFIVRITLVYHLIAGINEIQIGNAAAMTPEQWESDIIEAQKAHIDGFALNIGPQDSYTDPVVERAYAAAEKLGNFSLFLSFDYASSGPWPADRVITMINMRKTSPAQFYYQGKPLVSTFEGAQNKQDWPHIKNATNCIFVPTWTSLGPPGIANALDVVDGAFSWDAWPVGAEDKNTESDEAWMKALAGKPYMMPVSPWFYTNLPQWQKNWLWRGDDLWHYRWRQIMELQPPLVQIISWNDYGEAHYIGPIHDPGIPEGASQYVTNHSHDAWRTFLPHYISAYKTWNGTSIEHKSQAADAHSPKYSVSYAERINYWYRLNPSTSGSANGTTGNNPVMGQKEIEPGQVSQDRVFLSALVFEPRSVKVQIGDNTPTILSACTAGINHFSVPFNGQTGPVKMAIMQDECEIVTVTGPVITDQCTDGMVDWNAVVGSSDDGT